MNYYEHHLGDYAEATAHLSILEDGAYGRLLRKIYSTERPLPPEKDSVYRLVGARTKDERRAIDSVLAEYFELRYDGWHNERADREIARFHDKQAKAKASADARWSQSGRNANASKDTPPGNDATAMRTHSEGNAPRARSSPQSPVTKKRTPPLRGSPPKAKASKRCPTDFAVTAEMVAWAREQAPGVDVQRETIKFRNHEFAKGKSDWPATWRNWILEAADRLPRNAGKNLAQSFRERDAEAAAAEVREWTGGNGVTAKPHASPHQQQDTLDMEPSHAVLGHD